MYFVHSDCLPALGLSINVKNESERKLYAVAVVESKEFCYAKRVRSFGVTCIIDRRNLYTRVVALHCIVYSFSRY